jgi:hypothetical protein
MTREKLRIIMTTLLLLREMATKKHEWKAKQLKKVDQKDVHSTHIQIVRGSYQKSDFVDLNHQIEASEVA